MKLTLDRAALLRALEPAARIIERRNTIPVLGNVLLRADANDKLTLTGTDLDIELRSQTEARVETHGAVTVPAGTLHDIVRKLGDGAAITLEQTADAGRIILRSGRSRFQLPTLPDTDFPDIAAGEWSNRFEMPAADLARMVAATAFAISTEETRYYLNGVHWHALEEDGRALLACVATDGHRLARLHLPLPEGAAGMPAIIVPRKAVTEIGRLVAKREGTVTVELSASKIRLSVEGLRFTSKLIDGTFPDYRRVIPSGNDKRATLDAALLADATERVATISGERGRAVKLSLSAGQLVLAVTNPDSGEAREEIDCDYDGAEIEVGFNARYLGDILAVIGGDTVLVKLADPGSPAILQARDGADLLTVLMPMRV
jgi:DNA polymerase III subunit beta